MSDFIGYCPHCGNRAPQEECGRYQFREEENVDWGGLWICYFFMKCMTCSKPLVYEINDQRVVPDSATPNDGDVYQRLVYPAATDLDKCVPEKVRKRYAEASKIRDLSPNGFASQIRRSLEAVCKDRGIKPYPLQKALEELASKGEIPDRLSEMSDFIRMLGNIGSHDSDEDVLPEFVQPIDKFFCTVIEYVYVAQHNLDEFRRKHDSAYAKKESSKNTDDPKTTST